MSKCPIEQWIKGVQGNLNPTMSGWKSFATASLRLSRGGKQVKEGSCKIFACKFFACVDNGLKNKFFGTFHFIKSNKQISLSRGLIYNELDDKQTKQKNWYLINNVQKQHAWIQIPYAYTFGLFIRKSLISIYWIKSNFLKFAKQQHSFYFSVWLFCPTKLCMIVWAYCMSIWFYSSTLIVPEMINCFPQRKRSVCC